MNDVNRLMFIRPLTLAIFLSVTLELINYFIFAVLAEDSNHLLGQFVWTVLIGGIGLGAILGVFLDIIVVGRLQHQEAIQGTVLLSTLILGVCGKLVTIGLVPQVMTVGIVSSPVVYFFFGLSMALAGGYAIGWLLFTEDGERLLARYGF